MSPNDWEYVCAMTLKPGDMTRYGTVTEVTVAGRLTVVTGNGWQCTWHNATPIEKRV